MTSPIFTASELEEFRSLSEASLPHVVMFQKDTRTALPGGRVIEAWEATVMVGCRLMPGSLAMQDTSIAAQPGVINRWVLVIPLNIEVEEGWRAVVTGTSVDGTAWSRTMVVVQPLGPRTYEVMRKVIVTEVGVGGR